MIKIQLIHVFSHVKRVFYCISFTDPPVFSILAEDEKLPPSRMSFVPMAFRNLMLRGCTA